MGLIALLMLAGCAGSPAEPDSATSLEEPAAPSDEPGTPSASAPSNDSIPPAVEDTSSRSLRFEKTFDITITHGFVQNANHRVNLDSNCVGFGKDQVWLVLNGTAEAKWTATNTFATRMKVDIRDAGLVATNGGSTSPSLLQFGSFHAVPNAALGLLFAVQPADTGIVAKQTASFSIAFNYLGKPELKTELMPCTYQ